MSSKPHSKQSSNDEFRCVSLTLAGKDLDPDKITKSLGIQPDNQARKGDRFGKKRRMKFGLWSLYGRPSGAQLHTQMKNILRRISPVKNRLRRIIKSEDVKRAYLMITFEPPLWTWVSEQGFPAETINAFTS